MNAYHDSVVKKITYLKRFAYFFFPAFFLSLILLYLINPSVYIDFTYEDNGVEWLTFILLVASGILSIIIANGIRKKYRYFHWFFILFSVFTILAAWKK